MFTKKTTVLGGLAALAVLAVPSVAGAHVTVQPPQAAAGGYSVIDVRVPNEQDDQGTVKLQVQFPPGVASASYQPLPGWKVRVTTRKAAKPIEVHGEQVSDEIDTVTWTGDGRTGIVAPGQFQDFPLSIRVPDGAPGTALTFKALQTYEDGEVVRWIGASDGESPAPQLTLEAAADEHGATAGAAKTETPAADHADTADAADDDGDSSTLAIVLGALGLVAGLAGLGVALAGRRRAS